MQTGVEVAKLTTRNADVGNVNVPVNLPGYLFRWDVKLAKLVAKVYQVVGWGMTV